VKCGGEPNPPARKRFARAQPGETVFDDAMSCGGGDGPAMEFAAVHHFSAWQM
jgi:hypothetical protein